MEIKDYPNYLIYDDARVYNKNRKRFLKPSIRNNYLRVALNHNGKQKQFSINRLVAEHYIPNPDNKPEVDHIDTNTKNNHVSNLRWVTHQENIDHRIYTSNTGEKYICYIKDRDYYQINVKGNRINLKCKDYSLQDAINLRDSLLMI